MNFKVWPREEEPFNIYSFTGGAVDVRAEPLNVRDWPQASAFAALRTLGARSSSSAPARPFSSNTTSMASGAASEGLMGEIDLDNVIDRLLEGACGALTTTARRRADLPLLAQCGGTGRGSR